MFRGGKELHLSGDLVGGMAYADERRLENAKFFPGPAKLFLNLDPERSERERDPYHSKEL